MVHLLRSGLFVLQAAKLLLQFSCSSWCLLMRFDEFGQHVNMSTCAFFSTRCKLKVSGLWQFGALNHQLRSARGVSMSSGYPGPGLPEVSHQHWAIVATGYIFWDSLRLLKRQHHESQPKSHPIYHGTRKMSNHS